MKFQQQMLIKLSFYQQKFEMRNIGFLRTHSPFKSPLKNLSPRHHLNHRNHFQQRQGSTNLSPLRRNKNHQENNGGKSPVRTPRNQRISFLNNKIKVQKEREQSYEFMESTIKKKRGLFHEALKKKEVRPNPYNQMIVKTANNEQNNKPNLYQVSDRRKRGSLPDPQPANLDQKKFQTLLQNVKQIQSIHCSKAHKEPIYRISPKNNGERKQIKTEPDKIHEVFISSFGGQKPCEVNQENRRVNTVEKNGEKQNPEEKKKGLEESYGDVNMLLKKINERPLNEKLIESDEEVKVSVEEKRQDNFSMNPFMS